MIVTFKNLQLFYRDMFIRTLLYISQVGSRFIIQNLRHIIKCTHKNGREDIKKLYFIFWIITLLF